MPNTRSAKKALRQAEKRTIENRKVKRAYKDAIKAVERAADKGEKSVDELISAAQKKLDKAAKRGTIKKNTAGRILSRLQKRVQAIAKK